MHALIIEDEYLLAIVMREELVELGFTSFDLVRSEADAVVAAERRCPDLILADERLNLGSGAAAVTAICRDRTIPVVFVTASRHEVLRHVPAAIVVDKPYDEAAIKAAIELARQWPFECASTDRY